jgi:ATP-dependent DNA ligase
MNLPVLELIEKVSLSCQEGTSDKVYHMQLCRVEGGFIVNIQHGKRMYDVPDEDKSQSALQKLSKPDSGPTTYEKAKELFDEKFKEKLQRKRYEYYQSGHVVNMQSSMYNPQAASSQPVVAQQTLIQPEALVLTGTGYIPQLLNATTPGGCESFLADNSYYASPKADGIRFMLGLVGGEIAASNRRGEGIAVPRHLETALAGLVEATDNSKGLCLDGELVGSTMYVFDILELAGQALSPRSDRQHTPMPYFIRARQMQRLSREYAAWRGAQPDEAMIKFLPIARSEKEKRKLFRELLNSSAEGIVFTHIQSVLRPGKPNSGGDRFKFKFNKEIDCVVKTTDRRSFECFVYHNAQPVSVGFCASGVTDSIFNELLMAERRGETKVAVVRYLYATGGITEGGKLFQSTFLNFRTDKRPEECLASQLEKTNRNVLEEIRLDEAA